MPHQSSPSVWLLAGVLVATLWLTESRLQAENELPWHQKIDALLEQTRFGPVAPMADEATFLRRVTLDFAGRIPTTEEVRQLLADDSPEKRRTVIDRLLASPEFPRHLAVIFELILMERRGGAHVKTEEFRQFLEESFAAGKSYREIVREILAADGTGEKNRAAAAFYLERQLTPDLLTRDVGRIFFGIDLQCAQCHNHPNIDDYHQEDYYGLQAFVLRASLHQPDKKQPAVIAEKAEGEAAFQSVFTGRASMTGPRLPGGEELVDVVLKPGERYEVAPAKDVRHVPKHSRLQRLAETAFSQPTEQFNRNLANRLWGHMLGRGLVHPPDLHHSGNPPTHPELLELLAEAVQATDYDIKTVLREIALSQVYQLSDQPQAVAVSRDELEQQIAALSREMETEKQNASQADQQVETAVETLDAAAAELKPLREAIAAAEKQIVEATKKRDEAAIKLKTSQTAMQEQQTQTELVQQAFEKTELAAKAIEKDPQLSTALESLTAKLKSLQQELTKRTEEAATAAEQQQQTEQQLTTARTTADQAQAAAIPVEQKVRHLRDELIAVRQRAAEHRSQAALAGRKQTYLATLVESLKREEQITALKSAYQVQLAEFNIAQEALPLREADLKSAEQTHKAASVELTQALKILTEHSTQHAELQTTHRLLAASLDQLAQASKRLPEGEELSEAHTQITTTLAAAETRMTAAATQMNEQQAIVKTRQSQLTAAQDTLQAAAAALKQQQETIAQLSAQLRKSQESLADARQQAASLHLQIEQQAAERLNAVTLTPLSPEQLGLSMLVATGQLARIRNGEQAKLDKESPLPEADQSNPEALVTRQREVETATAQAATRSLSSLISLFGAGAGQPQEEFFATADQALFLSNGNELRSWLSPGGDNLTERLLKLETPAEIGEELYLSLFSRKPSQEERELVKVYLAQRESEKSAAVQELAWGLLTSVEFRFRY